MINKNKSQKWVKIVAWMLAISFGLGMTLFLAIPTPTRTVAPKNTAPSNNPAPPGRQSLTPINGGQTAGAADGALGQGDLAMKTGKIDQAIGFYETAYRLDKKDKTIQEKLGDAYFSQGQQAQDSDKTKAKDAYGKYLELLPEGPKAKSVRAALDNL